MHAYFHYLTYPYLLKGLIVVFEITILSAIGSLLLGVVLAAMRESRFLFIHAPVDVYVWIIRGTPILVQLIFFYDVLPLIGFTLPAVPTAVIAFTLHEGAFMGELIRGGLHSVNQDQITAAESLGCSKATIMRKVRLPQAVRAMVPPFGNQFIGLLKGTSLASAISVNELTLRTTTIVSANFLYIPVFAASGTLYLIATTTLVFGQRYLERKFNASFEPQPGPWKRYQLKRRLARLRAELRTQDALLASARGQASPRVGEPPLLECSDVTKYYGDRLVLDRASLEVAEGEVVALIGPSGSGKSTLLKLVNHLEAVDGGSIQLGGEYVGYEETPNGLKPVRDLASARAKARVAMVFQQFNLFSHLTARQNVMFGLVYVYNVSRQEAVERADKALDAVGLLPFANQKPAKLSGGQQQRVAIARALVTDPRLILLDEPTSALDPELIGEVRAVLKSLAENGMTMICATHDMDFATNVADRVVVLIGGKVVEEGVPSELFRNPRNEKTRQFLRLLEPEFEGAGRDLIPSSAS